MRHQPAPGLVDAPWADGYAFVDGSPDRLLTGRAIATHLEQHADVAAAASRLDGCFAAVVERGDETVLVTDRYGAVPLYVRAELTRPVVASGDPWAVVASSPTAPALDPIGVFDMVRLGYVAGERTLVEGVHTIPPASVVRVRDDGAEVQRYWRFEYRSSDAPPELHEKRLDVAFDTLAARIDAMAAMQDREVVLMLSGGIDTRSLAALLATRAASDARCISYGLPDDPDVAAAREIAAALGFPFEYAPIGPEVLDDDAFFDQGVHEVGIASRLTCGAGARIAPLPDDGLVITGHTGFLSSDFALMNYGVRTKPDVRRMIYARHFSYYRSEAFLRNALALDTEALRYTSLDETLADFDPDVEILGELHRWNQEHRQRNLVYREYRAYAARSAWMLPLGSHDIVDVFLTLPWSLRFDQTLYKRIVNRLFTGRAEALADIGRVGASSHRFEPDPAAPRYHRWRTVQRWQPVSGAVLTRALPAAKRLGRGQRNKPAMRAGATPLRHWFTTDGTARERMLERLDAVTVPEVRAEGVRAAMFDPRAGERVFQLLYAGALTVQGVHDEAQRVWRAARAGA